MTRLLWALVVLALGYEAATLSNDAAGDTISEVVWGLTDAYGGIVGLLFGVLMGHFFWPRRMR
jgi:hypothetical protein